MDTSGIEQMAEEVKNVMILRWKPLTCSQCDRQAPMVREMTALDASSEEDGITSSIVIAWKPSEGGWVRWMGSGPIGVHCPDCNRKVREQLAQKAD